MRRDLILPLEISVIKDNTATLPRLWEGFEKVLAIFIELIHFSFRPHLCSMRAYVHTAMSDDNVMSPLMTPEMIRNALL